MDHLPRYYRYWGKYKAFKSHPLWMHSLDVASVAHQWWEHSPIICKSFIRETNLPEKHVQAWVLFFIALHDLGKLDVRFQIKVPEIAPYDEQIKKKVNSGEYDHGKGGYQWFVQESDHVFEGLKSKQKRYMQNWLAHTAGHHGKIPNEAQPNPLPSYLKKEASQDQLARKTFIEDMANLFLKPQNISVENINLPEKPPALLAGFCCVCDWLGSNTDYFPYQDKSKKTDLFKYFEDQKKKAKEILKAFGLLKDVMISEGGMKQIYPCLPPRGIQKIISDLSSSQQSLTIIESNTGSGKTEAAIAFASDLLAKDLADSITFALPTQATANAIFHRLKEVAGKIFSSAPNLILAHGKSLLNPDFQKLKEKQSKQVNGTQGNDAGIQCHEWLSLSRKRAFLGQIAVTTVDQVLLSAIESLKHAFVRSFGIVKSVLIIDEVHAYDSYMYGLLKKVIETQKKAGGSVILLSATLPFYQKKQLLEVWGTKCTENNSQYPLITQAVKNEDESDKRNQFCLKYFSIEQKENSEVCFELWPNNEMTLNQGYLDKIAKAVNQEKTRIGIICNLVDDAQKIAKQLQNLKIPVDILHSRYRYKDRMEKEACLMQKYGKANTEKGCVLVGTQVLEQSLDIDFDWLITFLCPIDLLFQRMGRLHRHEKQRPTGFETPFCSLVLPEKSTKNYKSHEYIYKNKRVLWRTQQMLYECKTNKITFPKAYREWIEKVYQENPWENEPEEITTAFVKYQKECRESQQKALDRASAQTHFSDTDENASMLTREGIRNLSVVPVIQNDTNLYFLDGKICKENHLSEDLYQNIVPVPSSWKSLIPSQSKQVIYYLVMQNETQNKKYLSEVHNRRRLCYTMEYGLQKIKVD